MGHKPKFANATVAAVQRNIEQTPAATAKLSNNKSATPISKPQTPISKQQPLVQKQAPVAKPYANQKPGQTFVQAQQALLSLALLSVLLSQQKSVTNNKPKPTSSVKHVNPLAPLTPGKAAAGLPDNVFGNMFDLPVKWAASLKPAKPVQRIIGPQRAPVQQMQHLTMNSKPLAKQNQKAPLQKKAQASSPIKPQQFRAAPKKYDMGPGYEGFFQAALFQEPASWTRNQSPCHAPHRAAPKQLNKQPSFKAATPISKPSTPAPKAQANNNLKGNKAASVSATKNKNAIKWNSPAGKQLILRPKNELVIYTPLWIQVYHWAQFRGQKQQRGRSAEKTTRAQRLLQQKQRIATERNPNDRQQATKSPIHSARPALPIKQPGSAKRK